MISAEPERRIKAKKASGSMAASTDWPRERTRLVCAMAYAIPELKLEIRPHHLHHRNKHSERIHALVSVKGIRRAQNTLKTDCIMDSVPSRDA